MAAVLGGRPIRAVLFDYGLTLVTFARPGEALLGVYATVARHLETAGVGLVPPPATLVAEVHDRVEDAVARHETAGCLREIDVAAEERRAYAALGIELSDALLDEVTGLVQRAWWEGVVVPPATFATLEELRRQGLRLGLCSNAPYRPRSLHDQLAHLGLDGLLDSATFSSEVGWRKPAPEIFEAALRALGADAGRCAMVGDRRREDVAGARAAGLATIRVREHFDDPGPGDADALIDGLCDLVGLLFPQQERDRRGSVGGDEPSRRSGTTRQEP